jgi:hypothetical protein
MSIRNFYIMGNTLLILLFGSLSLWYFFSNSMQIKDDIQRLERNISGLEHFSKEPSLSVEMLKEYDEKYGTTLQSNLAEYKSPKNMNNAIVSESIKEVLIKTNKILDKKEKESSWDWKSWLILIIGAILTGFFNKCGQALYLFLSQKISKLKV